MVLKELHTQPLLLREPGSSPRRIVDEIFKKKGISPLVIMESASTSAIKRMVAGGVGLAIISRQAVRKEVEEKKLKELTITDVDIFYKFYLIHHKDKYFSQALKAFFEVAMEEAPRLFSDNQKKRV